MMQEYALAASPSVARRLVQLAGVSSAEITLDIAALALEGLLGDEDFASYPTLTSRQRGAVQRLIDYQLRGVLLADDEESARETVLAAALIAGIKPIVVCSRHLRSWRALVNRMGLHGGVDARETPDVLFVDSGTVLRQEVIEPRRNGMLIIEHTERSDFVQGAGENDQAAVREFQRTVIIANFGGLTRTFHQWTRQCDIALQISLEYLWPNEALSILAQTPAVVEYLKRSGFRKCRAADLYFMFNVVPELLGARGPR
jgi:hypothetical protein